jgi:hypothetical protein
MTDSPPAKPEPKERSVWWSGSPIPAWGAVLILIECLVLYWMIP